MSTVAGTVAATATGGGAAAPVGRLATTSADGDTPGLGTGAGRFAAVLVGRFAAVVLGRFAAVLAGRFAAVVVGGPDRCRTRAGSLPAVGTAAERGCRTGPTEPATAADGDPDPSPSGPSAAATAGAPNDTPTANAAAPTRIAFRLAIGCSLPPILIPEVPQLTGRLAVGREFGGVSRVRVSPAKGGGMNPTSFAGRIAAAAGTVAVGGLLALASASIAAAEPAQDSPAGPARNPGAQRPAVATPSAAQRRPSATPVRAVAAQRRSNRTPPPTAARRIVPSDSVTATPTAAAGTAVDPLTTFLNNVSPQPSAIPAGQTPAGVVSGALAANDLDSPVVGFALARPPARGSVTVTGTGQYAYTADPTLAHTGYVDSFGVIANEAGSGFHIHGLGGLINMLTFGLIGVSGHIGSATVTVRVAPFNNAPTATVRIDPPDPVTGVVTGRVIGADTNGDTLTYQGSVPAMGTVIVGTAGDFTYSPGSAALAGGRDEFTVTVDDAYGGTVTVPVVVRFGPPAPAAELSTFCGCTLMPADTVFHTDVSSLPVLAMSQTWTTLLGGTLHASWGRPPWMGSSPGMPVNVVDAGLPGETVIFNRGYATTGPGIDDTLYAIPDRPLVEGMPDVPAWDRHLLVFEQGTCISQELYNVANGVELPAAGVQDALGNAAYAALWGSSWIAEAGGHVDMSSGLYPAQGWANASRLPYLPLILRPDDLSRGTIDHMLGIAIAKDRGTGYTWPARAGDGTGTNPDGVPMGTVLRLRADFDLSAYDPATQVVLRALQQHGAVVFDSFAAGRDGAGLLAMGNGWTGTDYITAQEELSTIPLSAFEAVDVLGLAADTSTGWTTRI